MTEEELQREVQRLRHQTMALQIALMSIVARSPEARQAVQIALDAAERSALFQQIPDPQIDETQAYLRALLHPETML